MIWGSFALKQYQIYPRHDRDVMTTSAAIVTSTGRMSPNRLPSWCRCLVSSNDSLSPPNTYLSSWLLKTNDSSFRQFRMAHILKWWGPYSWSSKSLVPKLLIHTSKVRIVGVKPAVKQPPHNPKPNTQMRIHRSPKTLGQRILLGCLFCCILCPIFRLSSCWWKKHAPFSSPLLSLHKRIENTKKAARGAAFFVN